MRTFSQLSRIFNFFFVGAFVFQAQATTQTDDFIMEAERLVTNVSEKGAESASYIDEFFSEFSQQARQIVELDIAVERAKERGDLCAEYSQCPEKYELVRRAYDNAMGEIQQSFNKYYPHILPAFSSFNKTIYKGLDNFADLRSNEIAQLPMEVELYKEEYRSLLQEQSDIEAECDEVSKRKCERLLRQHSRKAQKLNQHLNKLNYTMQIQGLTEGIQHRLTEVLSGYTYLEEDTAFVLSEYAYTLDNYARLSNSQDIGKLMDAIDSFKDLEAKTNQLSNFATGLQQILARSGNLLKGRLDVFSGEYGVTATSREAQVTSNVALIEANGNLLKELEAKLEDLN